MNLVQWIKFINYCRNNNNDELLNLINNSNDCNLWDKEENLKSNLEYDSLLTNIENFFNNEIDLGEDDRDKKERIYDIIIR